jgi:hypothetical protein
MRTFSPGCNDRAVDAPQAGAPAAAEPGTTAPSLEEHALSAMSPRMLLGQALSGGVAPFVAYELCRRGGLSDPTSLAVSAVPPALAIVGEWAWRRRLNVIGIIVLTGILIGLAAVGFLNGNELLLKMRESVVTGMFGLVCLVTLVLPMRPAMFHVGKALASAGDRARGREFATLWDEPRARRVFIILTLGWGLGLLLEAVVRAVLALELSTGSFLAIVPVVGWVVTASLLFWTFSYSRRTRRRGEAEAAQTAQAVVAR